MPKTYTRRSRSRYNTIRKLRITNNVDGAIKLVQKMAKQINQKFYRLEKAGINGSSIGYKNAAHITGKVKPRFSTSAAVLAKMQIDDLFNFAFQLNSLNITKDTTITGYRERKTDRITKGVKRLNERFGIDITQNEFIDFLNLGGDEFINSKYLDSAQVIEDFIEFTRNGNLSGAEFLREFKRYRKQLGKLKQEDNDLFTTEGKQFDYIKIRRNLINLQARKTKRNDKM